MVAILALVSSSVCVGQLSAPGTDYVSFWSGELRIFAQRPDTEVEIIDIDTNTLLSPDDLRLDLFGAWSNPFLLANVGDMFLGRGGTQSVNLEIRVRIITRDPGNDDDPPEDKPVTVWTGANLGPTNAWGSYIPASFVGSNRIFSSEVGCSFVGFTQRDLILVAPTNDGLITVVTVDNLDDGSSQTLTFDASIPICPPLAATEPPIPVAATPCYLLDDTQVQVVYLNAFSNERLLLSSNADLSALVGNRLLGFVGSDDTVYFNNTDWSSSPPSFAAGDRGMELGTEFFAFVRSGLAIFPTEDATTVTITDLSDGDDSVDFILTAGYPGQASYDIYTPYLEARNGINVVPRDSDPQVFFTTNSENPIDNDVLKIEADKPILVYQGPVGSDTHEHSDVAFSVPTGPQEWVVYAYAQNFDDSNDFQLFAFQRNTQVRITSLSYTDGFRDSRHHDFTVDFDVPVGWFPQVTATPPSHYVANPTAGDIQHFGSGAWAGELVRVESNNPITVITGDHDKANFGAYIPFLPTSPNLPPEGVGDPACFLPVCEPWAQGHWQRQ